PFLFSLRYPTFALCLPLSLHDALPISVSHGIFPVAPRLALAQSYAPRWPFCRSAVIKPIWTRLAVFCDLIGWAVARRKAQHAHSDRKSTRLNSSHVKISYAVFCLKKKI